jgi:hypothetical protein
MSNFTKNLVYFSFILFSISLVAQVGIGTTTPSEELEVVGNVRFSGAIMPNNDAGTAGQILTSNGAGASPTWSAAMLNQAQTTGMGKFFSGTFNIPANYSTLILTDANCVISSTCTITWIGDLPSGPDYGDLVTTVEAQNGQWVFHFANYTGYNLNNFQFSYFAFY